MKFQKLGKYTLLEQMAAGGMAEIHLAIGAGAEDVNHFFAIKKILTAYSENDEFITMFKEEAKIASQLNHSNIINIFDFGVDKTSQFYIVMEFVHGKNLKQIIQALGSENRKLPVEFIAFIIKEVASGLDYAHKAIDNQSSQPLNIIHRDVSPQNIMVSYNGEVKVIDFGVAKSAVKAETTGSGTLRGKFGYMSPEQVRGEDMDHRTDLFSLGVITWELLTSRRLFASETELETMNKIKQGFIPDLANHIDPNFIELANIVNRCLESNPEKRFQSGQDLAAAIDMFLITHFPEFNKHVFSDYLKNTFYHSFEKSQEKLENYSKAKINTNEFTEFSTLPDVEPSIEDSVIAVGNTDNGIIVEEEISANVLILNANNPNPGTDSNSKKDLTWIYGSIAMVMFFLFYIIGYEIPKNKTKHQVATKGLSEIYKTKVSLFKNFEMPFENILEMTGIGNQACIQTVDKKTFCWGDNRFHQLGVSTSKDYVQLIEINSFPKWESLQVGMLHSCGITKIAKENNDWLALKCWGDNSFGQIGDPIQKNVSTPTIVDSNTQYKAISVGLYHTCGITTDGTAKCWGQGEYFQLGLTQIKSSKVPLTVDPNMKFKSIASGAFHTCAIQLDDTLRCWGRNDYGQLGTGKIQNQGAIENVDTKTRYKQIALGDFHSCGITTDNKVKCWGMNDFGQTGLGHRKSAETPAYIQSELQFKKVKVGKYHTCAETADHDLYCWGRNNYFQLTSKEVSQLLKPTLTLKLNPTSDFLLGEFSTCYSMTKKLSCRGYHWIQNTRAPAEAN
jgi:serine/threonine protein kinase